MADGGVHMYTHGTINAHATMESARVFPRAPHSNSPTYATKKKMLSSALKVHATIHASVDRGDARNFS